MSSVHEITLRPEAIDRFAGVLGEEAVTAVRDAVTRLQARARDRIVWNVNSTAVGGGVAEMLRSLIAYARGAGIDTRWIIMGGSPAFFGITKRLHNALHGAVGDRSPLGDAERSIYETTTLENAHGLVARVRPGDIVLLHDPQTAGLARRMRGAGASVIWRCHIGVEQENEETLRGWRFLMPYLEGVDLFVFSRSQYVPSALDRSRVAIVQPSIDPFSAKNQDLPLDTARAIVAHVGLVNGASGPTTFTRQDGTPGRVDRFADIVCLGPAPHVDQPLIVQVSRWDALKDPIGVMAGFARLAADGRQNGAHLLLAGPNVHAVADDPESTRVLDETIDAWRSLPHDTRRLVTLACLPTEDVVENATIVNAIQRHATIIVQKSLEEGFGLTVTEAMWKGRPIVASAVGGIVDQIEDGTHGLLIQDPRDVDAFAHALARLLADPELRRAVGTAAHTRAKQRFLALRSLADYGRLIEKLSAAAE